MIWIDDDFPQLLVGDTDRSHRPRLYVEGQEVTYQDEVERIRFEQEAAVQARTDAALRSMAQLSAQHPLTGYDRNVIQQWIDAGACGKRPELSFEILRNFRNVHELAAEEAARQELARRKRQETERAWRELREKKKARSQRMAERRAEWDAQQPVAARIREERKAVVKGRREAAQRQRQQELAEEAAVQRVMRIVRTGGKAAVLTLNEEDFDRWLKHASTEALEAFGEDLLRDGRRLRDADGQPTMGLLWRLGQVLHWLASRV